MNPVSFAEPDWMLEPALFLSDAVVGAVCAVFSKKTGRQKKKEVKPSCLFGLNKQNHL